MGADGNLFLGPAGGPPGPSSDEAGRPAGPVALARPAWPGLRRAGRLYAYPRRPRRRTRRQPPSRVCRGRTHRGATSAACACRGVEHLRQARLALGRPAAGLLAPAPRAAVSPGAGLDRVAGRGLLLRAHRRGQFKSVNNSSWRPSLPSGSPARPCIAQCAGQEGRGTKGAPIVLGAPRTKQVVLSAAVPRCITRALISREPSGPDPSFPLHPSQRA